MPTGGIGPANLAGYLRRPNVIACGGSWIAPVEVVEAGHFALVAERAREATEIVRVTRADQSFHAK